MTEMPAGTTRHPWWKKGRTAAVGFALGASLALSPLVWAENPPKNPVPAATEPAPMLPRQSFAPLVKRVLPAVVNISVTEKPDATQMSEELPPGFAGTPFDQFLRRFFQQGPGQMPSPFNFPGSPNGQNGVQAIALGSGFIIQPSGYVVTNNHVVGEASRITVILQDGKKYRATIVGRDPKTDLAVLKVNADTPLPYVSFGDSSKAEVGDWVLAVGNPFGLGGTVTTGIISARGRNINDAQLDDFLQIDAPINRGNSGGPTFNLQGKVIGINTAIYSPNGGSVGIGFAIPSNLAKSVVDQLIAHGKVSRGWLGVQIQQVTPAIAASLGLKNDHGAMVAVVNHGSPAGKAGVEQGDVILSFNGKDVTHLRDLPRLVAAASPGSTAALKVWRHGQLMDLQVHLGAMPENPRIASAGPGAEQTQPSEAEAFGLHFARLTDSLRHRLGVGKGTHGVVVTGIENGSPAENMGLSRGDVVETINQQPVDNPHQAAEKLRQIAKSPQKDALLLLNRHGVTQYIGIDLGHNRG